jgi:hypothetical protein
MGRAACEACSATWSLDTNSAFALGSRKTTENLDRVSPALNTRTLTVDPIWLLLYFEEKFTCLFVQFFFVHTLDEQQRVVYNICRGCNCLSIDKFKSLFWRGEGLLLIQ